MNRSERAGLTILGSALGVLLLQAACRENPGSPNAPPVKLDGQFHQVRWSAESGPRQFAVFGSRSNAAASASPVAASAGDAHFWAYRNRDVTFTLSVQDEDGSWRPYVTLVVPKGSLLRRPDGSPFLTQDSIEITVTPDPSALEVQLEPTGLVFNPLIPASFTISYEGADPDFDHNGVVDLADQYIQQVLLGLNVRQAITDPWTVLPSYNDVVGQTLSASLRHFTGYAVSW